jgi:hypothetical protein
LSELATVIIFAARKNQSKLIPMVVTKPFIGRLDQADTMSAEQIASFSNGYKTVLLPVGTELWRFVSQKEHNRFGAFWMEPQTMASIMQTLHSNGNFTQEYKKENIRNSLAVLNSWSHLNMRLKVKLTKEVIAHVGATGYQRQIAHIPNQMAFGGGDKIQKVTETRRGGHVQYVIPRFRGLPNSNEWARIEVYVHI